MGCIAIFFGTVSRRVWGGAAAIAVSLKPAYIITLEYFCIIGTCATDDAASSPHASGRTTPTLLLFEDFARAATFSTSNEQAQTQR